MSEKENIALMQAAYKAFADGDLDAVLDTLSDDCVWTVPGNSVISGTYVGKDELIGLLSELGTKGFTHDPDTWAAGGDTVIVLSTVTQDDRVTRWVDVWTLDAERVVAWEGIGDARTMEEVWGLK
jgi:ketosteroid isomerase-like protein